MLRVEKKSRSRPVHVKLRERTRMLTTPFLRALAIAVGLHASGLILFNVQPFKIYQTRTQFPPVQVNIEMALPDSAIFAELEGNKKQQTPIAEPTWSEPKLDLRSLSTQDHILAFPKINPFPEYPFSKSREKVFMPDWVTFTPPDPSPQSTIAIHISGPLAERSILPNSIPDQSRLSSKKGRRVSARYAVKVDDRTGKIFWYHTEQPAVRKKARAAAETILTKLQFEPLSEGFLTMGKVEIHLTLPEKEEG